MRHSDRGHRVESDSMGPVRVPKEAYYGAQTQRAIENFPISGLRFQPELIHALGLIKYAAVKVNLDLHLMGGKISRAIQKAALEVTQGTWDEQFVLDVFQTGSGTSTNMNANEVIANRANELLGTAKGTYRPVHPNDHVNLGQSSNDVFPTSIHIAAVMLIRHELIPALKDLHKGLKTKARAFYSVLKIGRTHLQDATPIRLGQEFGGYARQVELSIRRMENVLLTLSELPLGGTAVGTGINTHPRFAGKAITTISEKTGHRFREAENHFEAQGARDALVETSAILKTLATSMIKIANDIRWMGSGPRCGIGEIHLPDTQPGSSIMPGKVNPVIPESLVQVCVQVIGNDAAITLGGLSGNFELNVMMPVMAYSVLQSITLLGHGIANFSKKCIEGLDADRERCEEMIEKSLALITALTPRIGYDRAARLAKKAYDQRKTIREVVEAENILSQAELSRILDPRSMISPGLRKK
jgi:fumarate hydratase, class II